MSNCIDVEDGSRVEFTPNQIDGEALLRLLNEAEQKVDDSNCVSDEIEGRLRIAWWYLCRNTTVYDDGYVEIRFGRGRSGHTWRDFRATLNVLKPFIARRTIRTLKVSDEYDRHETAQKIKVNFKTGVISFVS